MPSVRTAVSTILLIMMLPGLSLAGDTSVPGIEALHARAVARQEQLARDLAALDATRAAGVDASQIQAQRQQLLSLKEQNEGLIAAYEERLKGGQSSPSDCPKGAVSTASSGSSSSILSTVKNSLSSSKFDLRCLAACAAGGGLGFFLGKRFLGPKGGIIGAAAGALVAGFAAEFLIKKFSGNSTASQPSEAKTQTVVSGITVPQSVSFMPAAAASTASPSAAVSQQNATCGPRSPTSRSEDYLKLVSSLSAGKRADQLSLHANYASSDQSWRACKAGR